TRCDTRLAEGYSTHQHTEKERRDALFQCVSTNTPDSVARTSRRRRKRFQRTEVRRQLRLHTHKRPQARNPVRRSSRSPLGRQTLSASTRTAVRVLALGRQL